MSIIVGNSYGIPVVALRFFNLYGTRQALSNPYTGVLVSESLQLGARPAPGFAGEIYPASGVEAI